MPEEEIGMHKLFVKLLLALLCLAGCNLVKDTGETAKQGGEGAVGTAEKMKGGTVGGTDMDTGEPSGGEDQEGGY